MSIFDIEELARAILTDGSVYHLRLVCSRFRRIIDDIIVTYDLPTKLVNTKTTDPIEWITKIFVSYQTLYPATHDAIVAGPDCYKKLLINFPAARKYKWPLDWINGIDEGYNIALTAINFGHKFTFNEIMELITLLDGDRIFPIIKYNRTKMNRERRQKMLKRLKRQYDNLIRVFDILNIPAQEILEMINDAPSTADVEQLLVYYKLKYQYVPVRWAGRLLQKFGDAGDEDFVGEVMSMVSPTNYIDLRVDVSKFTGPAKLAFEEYI